MRGRRRALAGVLVPVALLGCEGPAGVRGPTGPPSLPARLELELVTDRSPLVADGSSSGTVTLVARQRDLYPVSGLEVRFEIRSGVAELGATDTVTDLLGEATVEVHAGLQSGIVEVLGSVVHGDRLLSRTLDLWIDPPGIERIDHSGPTNPRALHWSPDGTALIIGTSTIFPLDGGDVVHLGVGEASWHPDGTEVLARHGNYVRRHDLSGNLLAELYLYGVYRTAWVLDGTRVLATTTDTAYLLDEDLVEVDSFPLGRPTALSAIRGSSRVIVAGDLNGYPDGVFELDLDTHTVRTLITLDGSVEGLRSDAPLASVSHSGDRVVFTSGEEDQEDLYQLSLDGGEVEPLLVSPYVETAPALSPDGTRLAFVSDRGVSRAVHIWTLPASPSPEDLR